MTYFTVIAKAGMRRVSKQGMTDARANSGPPPNRLPAAAHHETHTPQSLNVSVLLGHTGEKSANPPDSVCEIEQNSDVRDVFPVRDAVGLSLSRCLSHRPQSEGALECLPLETFDL